jgi:thioredoxin 1
VYCVKTANLGLWLIGTVLAWGGWIVIDMSRPPQDAGSSLLSVVKGSTVPVLVEFYADWCGPCKMVGPVVEALGVEVSGKARVIRINVDEQRAASSEHGIRGIPTFIAFKNGKEVRREVGAISRQVMLDMLGL